ncbi:serine/threonine protein kinase, partial [Streptomyces sp. MCAF7]
ARNRPVSEAVRRRRVRLAVVAGALLAAVGIGGWLASGGDDDGEPPKGGEHSAPADPSDR